MHSQNLASLLLAEQKLVPAQAASAGEWKRWWYICIGGQALFLALVFAMRGRWSPRAAKRRLRGAPSAGQRGAGQLGSTVG